MNIPLVVLKYVKISKLKKIDISNDRNQVFRYKNYFLKIGNKVEIRNEYERLNYLYGKVHVPKPVFYYEEQAIGYLVTTRLRGNTCLKFIHKPKKLISILVKALKLFHQVEASNCPFNVGNGKTLIHGDFCLPNVIVYHGKIGFIDVGDSGLGDPFYDYAWCYWSLCYNIKNQDFKNELFSRLGVDFDEQKYIKYTK